MSICGIFIFEYGKSGLRPNRLSANAHSMAVISLSFGFLPDAACLVSPR
jgi:hypothetical protein